MNDHSPSAGAVASSSSRAPVHLRRFTADDFERMAEAGVFRRGEKVELIAGEIVAMSPVGRHHEVMRSELLIYWQRRCPPHLKVATESPLRLASDYKPYPDLMVFPANLVTPDVRGDTAVLVAEVSDTSLAYDTTTKAPGYAANGVREYWVIDAKLRSVKVHRHPEPDGYATTFKVAAENIATPELAPELAVRLADLVSG